MIYFKILTEKACKNCDGFGDIKNDYPSTEHALKDGTLCEEASTLELPAGHFPPSLKFTDEIFYLVSRAYGRGTDEESGELEVVIYQSDNGTKFTVFND